MWSINGSPIASANTFTGRSQQILCCCVSEMNEWDTQNVIVTGHSDGVVRVNMPVLSLYTENYSIHMEKSSPSLLMCPGASSIIRSPICYLNPS